MGHHSKPKHVKLVYKTMLISVYIASELKFLITELNAKIQKQKKIITRYSVQIFCFIILFGIILQRCLIYGRECLIIYSAQKKNFNSVIYQCLSWVLSNTSIYRFFCCCSVSAK